MSVTVSILALNNLALTTRCIESVLRAGRFEKLLLTNNGSTDGTAAYFDSLAEKDPRIHVIHNEKNLGFIEPNLRALAMTETDCFLMLNNDCVVADVEWLVKLARPMQNPMAALSAPECCASKLRDDLSGYRAEKGGDFEYLEGSCLMCKTSIVKRHGLFSPDLVGAYGEDSDLGLRMRQLGYTLHAVEGVDVRHEGGATSAQIPEQVHEWEKANHAVMSKRWSRYLKTRCFNPTIVIRRQGAMGDSLLITPIITALSKKYPDAPIWVETQAVDLFLYNPLVSSATRGSYEGPNALRIDLDMAYENLPGLHIVDAYQQVAEKTIGEALEVEKRTTFYFDPTKGDRIQIPSGNPLQIPRGEDNWVGIHCEPTTWPGKNWPGDRWRTVIEHLRAIGKKVALVGTSKVLNMPYDLDLRELTSPLDLASVLSRCSLFIGHDSFPLHVAQSQGVPVIGLFGATRGKLILTDGSPSIAIDGTGHCAGARHRNPGLTFVQCEGDCMRSIQAKQVIEAIGKMQEVIA